MVLRFKLLLVTIILLLVVSILLWRLSDRFPIPEQPTLSVSGSLYPSDTIIRKGNMNGVPIAIPSNYLFFPIEYLDNSIWDPNKGKGYYNEKTYNDGIQNFSVYLQWPSFSPRSRDNEASYLASRNEYGPHNWLILSVRDDYIRSPRPPETQDNGRARILRGIIERLSTDKMRVGNEQEFRYHPEIYYELRGKDAETELQWAVPVGPGTEISRIWNRALYWEGDLKGVVSTMIICGNGALPNPMQIQSCNQEYDLPELQAHVKVRYTRNWLPQWREIQTRTKEFVLSLRADSKTLSATTE